MVPCHGINAFSIAIPIVIGNLFSFHGPLLFLLRRRRPSLMDSRSSYQDRVVPDRRRIELLQSLLLNLVVAIHRLHSLLRYRRQHRQGHFSSIVLCLHPRP